MSADGILGRYYSWTAGSGIATGTDIISQAKTRTGVSDLKAKKITLISSGSLAIDINNLGVSSTLYQDTDGLYKLSLGANDCLIGSLKIQAITGCALFVQMIF